MRERRDEAGSGRWCEGEGGSVNARGEVNNGIGGFGVAVEWNVDVGTLYKRAVVDKDYLAKDEGLLVDPEGVRVVVLGVLGAAGLRVLLADTDDVAGEAM